MDISVIVPMFNAEKNINRTIISILKQNFNKDYEIILINDGSTDNTELICKEYANTNKNIIYKKIKNAGVSNARNIGIKMSKGKYICFVDSDDTISENFLKDMYESITKNKVDLGICAYERIGNNNKITKKIESQKSEKKDYCGTIIQLQSNNMLNQIWNKIYKKEIIDNNKIAFPMDMSYGEDFRFVLEYLKKTKSIQIIDKTDYFYNNGSEGLNCKYNRDGLLINVNNIILLNDFFVEEKYDEKIYKNYIEKKMLLTIISSICKIYCNENKEGRNSVLYSFINEKEFKNNIIQKNWKNRFIVKGAKKHNAFFWFNIKILNFLKVKYKQIKLGY